MLLSSSLQALLRAPNSASDAVAWRPVGRLLLAGFAGDIFLDGDAAAEMDSLSILRLSEEGWLLGCSVMTQMYGHVGRVCKFFEMGKLRWQIK